jgi:hypothetical protein
MDCQVADEDKRSLRLYLDFGRCPTSSFLVGTGSQKAPYHACVRR